MMVRTRREVHALGAIWNDTMLWYAKAVRELLSRPVTKKAGWRYLAAMHAIDPAAWKRLKYLAAGEALPAAAEQDRYWNQCQHQSWYFFPWHRAYLHSFEDIVIDAIRSLGGPADDWALPYWNYSDTSRADAGRIPQVFLTPTMPDGSPNPLHVAARFGTGVPADDAELTDRIADNDFIG